LAIRINASGNTIWSQTYGGSNIDAFRDGVAMDNGDFILVGQTNSTDGDIVNPTNGRIDIWTLRINAIGELLNENSFGSSSDNQGLAMIELQNGNYMISGSNDAGVNGDVTSNNGTTDAWILEINDNLQLVQQASFGSSGFDRADDLIQLDNGDIIFTGVATEEDGDVVGDRGMSDLWIVRLSASLELIDQLIVGGSRGDAANGLTQLSDGNFAAVGSTLSSNGDITRDATEGTDALIVVFDNE